MRPYAWVHPHKYHDLPSCVLRASVSLWLTAVIEQPLWLYSSLTHSRNLASTA